MTSAHVPLGPDTRNREARKRGLLDAALTLFSEEGYGPVSTRRIAEVAGCSETLLFRYFGGKHGLLSAIASELLVDNETRRLVDREFDDISEYLEWYLLESCRGVREAAPALKVIVAALVNEPEMAAQFERLHDLEVEKVRQHLLQFQARGLIPAGVDLVAAATGIEEFSFAIGFLLQIVYRRSERELEPVAKQCARALTVGLRGDTPISPLPDTLRREAVEAARMAQTQIARITALLEQGPDPDRPISTRRKA